MDYKNIIHIWKTLFSLVYMQRLMMREVCEGNLVDIRDMNLKLSLETGKKMIIEEVEETWLFLRCFIETYGIFWHIFNFVFLSKSKVR